MISTSTREDNALNRLGIALCSPKFAKELVDAINAGGVDDDSMFALASHTHAGVYSVVAHDHAGVYAPVAHTHAPLAGLWANRPVTGLVDGLMYFATDEKIPYWYNVGDTTWYDATGAAHI